MVLLESQVKMLRTLGATVMIDDEIIPEVVAGLSEAGENPREGVQAILGIHETQFPTPDFLKSSRAKTSFSVK